MSSQISETNRSLRILPRSPPRYRDILLDPQRLRRFRVEQAPPGSNQRDRCQHISIESSHLARLRPIPSPRISISACPILASSRFAAVIGLYLRCANSVRVHGRTKVCIQNLSVAVTSGLILILVPERRHACMPLLDIFECALQSYLDMWSNMGIEHHPNMCVCFVPSSTRRRSYPRGY